MLKFTSFITESTEEKEAKLKHLEHPEDHFLNVGSEGFEHARDTLMQVHKSLKGEKGGIHRLTTKIDGSPSIVAGWHPEVKRFFVGSKSVFNKTPKINFSDEDIDANHGHAPGLADKLKKALKYLPKVIHSGIHQGDFIHDETMRYKDKENTHFIANTLKHSVENSSDEAKKIAKAKIGVAFHTQYKGNTIGDLKASYGKGDFSEHPDVHLMDVSHDFKTSNYTIGREKKFLINMKAAEKLHKSNPYPIVHAHGDAMKMYVNDSIKKDKKRSADGYIKWLEDYAGKSLPKSRRDNLLMHAKDNHEHFDRAFKLHNHIEGAKNALIEAMPKKHGDYSFSIGDKESKPEGYVAVTKDNRPTKLVHRAEFSKANFLKEEHEKHIVVAMGRMNPPTLGHEKMLDRVKTYATMKGADHMVYVSHSHDSKKNPLSPDTKMKHLQRAFPNTNMTMTSKDKSFFQHLENLPEQGYTHVTLLAGSDRVNEYKNRLAAINKNKIFKGIRVKSIGARKAKSTNFASTVSGTKTRLAAKKPYGDEFKKMLPSKIAANDEHARELHKDLNG